MVLGGQIIALLIGTLLRSSRGAHLVTHFPQCVDFSHKALKKGVTQLQRVQALRHAERLRLQLLLSKHSALTVTITSVS